MHSRRISRPASHRTAYRLLLSSPPPFPRGFAFGHDGRLFLASGIGPNGEGDIIIIIISFAPDERTRPSRLVKDLELSPLDLAVEPNGNILVSSEQPFGAPDAVATIREYDATEGRLVRVFSPNGLAEFKKPRGLRFGPDGQLYCVIQDEVVACDFTTGECLGAAVTMPGLNGQARRSSLAATPIEARLTS